MGLSEPRRPSRGWQLLSAEKLPMMIASSVVAICSRTWPRPEPLEPCSCRHSPCNRPRFDTKDTAAWEKSAFVASAAARLTKEANSFDTNRGMSGSRRCRDSRKDCMQDTRTRVGGHCRSASLETCSHSSSTCLATKSASALSSEEPSPALAGVAQKSWSLRRPPTAPQSRGTCSSAARAHAPRKAAAPGRSRSCVAEEPTAGQSASISQTSSPHSPSRWKQPASAGAETSSSKHSLQDWRSMATRPVRYSAATLPCSSPRLIRVIALLTASSTESPGHLSWDCSASRTRAMWSSACSRMLWKAGTSLCWRRTLAQQRYAATARA
mmetsp:Transcript_23463/g.67002  ORF Transcript_23463/g.67002 Transcript_23463/m.67002 type:complete len:325 (+) Transcript_23463:1083-2057(+)